MKQLLKSIGWLLIYLLMLPFFILILVIVPFIILINPKVLEQYEETAEDREAREEDKKA